MVSQLTGTDWVSVSDQTSLQSGRVLAAAGCAFHLSVLLVSRPMALATAQS
jgi:hypothetical protein